MITIFGKPLLLLYGQLTLGLINGAFYALLSLGLAIIFGLLNIINFAHGALFMLGAVVAWMLLQPNDWLPDDWTPFGIPLHWNLQVSEQIGVTYWPALLIAPLIVGAFAGCWIVPASPTAGRAEANTGLRKANNLLLRVE